MNNELLLPQLPAALLAIGMVGCCGHAGAYEDEPGVPLTISAELGTVGIEGVAIRLQGREVTVSTELRNETSSRQIVGFYAATPLFSQLGVGEEHEDKRFTDLRVLVGAQSRKVTMLRRGYFLGRDITDVLLKAGLSPLPDINADPRKLARLPAFQGIKPDMWQGSVVHSWTDSMAPKTTAVHEVHYRALPQFGMEQLASDNLSRSVRQHCGDPEAVRQRVAAVSKAAEYALVERYEIRVPFATFRHVTVDVAQPARNWLGAHPVVALTCAASGQGTQLHGETENAGQDLDVLVISSLDEGGVDDTQ